MRPQVSQMADLERYQLKIPELAVAPPTGETDIPDTAFVKQVELVYQITFHYSSNLSSTSYASLLPKTHSLSPSVTIPRRDTSILLTHETRLV
jgi:hypothetical protein